MKARNFAIAFVILSFAVAGCSSPASAPTQITTPPTQVAQAATPSTPATSEPSPTATEVTPQLEVVEWYLWTELPEFEGDVPLTFIEVLVRNPYDYPVNVYEPAVQFLNAGEVVLRTRDIHLYLYADAGWNMILPGETVPGQIIAWPNRFISEKPEWDSFTISADIEEATPIPYTTDLDITTGSFTYREDSLYSVSVSTLYTNGTVTNTSGQPLKTILLRSIVRDASGHFVGSGLIGVIGDFFDGKYQNLEPGGIFEIQYLPAYVNPALSSEPLQFEVTGFGIIAE